MRYPQTRSNLQKTLEPVPGHSETGLRPTAIDDSPNRQDLRTPAFSRSLRFPELDDWSTLGPDKDDGSRAHDELTYHEKI